MSQTFASNDFNDIMDSLVLFMKSQNEFKDMNFDGSAIRELLRVLAYNTQQIAYQNNFVYNELQLDTAQLRQNVTSIASRLGYTPSSKSAAKIKVKLVITPSDLASALPSLVMSKSVQFYATKDSQTFILSPNVDYVASLVGGVYTFNDVTLLQGVWAANSFMVQSNEQYASYVVPNSGVDTNTLTVAVRTSENTSVQTLYSPFKTAYDLDPIAKLYFLRENRDGLYEFKFGDGNFSAKVAYGNIVTVSYMVTKGAEGNNLTSISPASSINGYYDIAITPIDARTYGGSDQEGIESIRSLAPITFAAAGNAVVPGDYVALAKKLFPETLDAISWGGEINVPPAYGNVFVSVIPKNSESLSASQKVDLAYVLSKYNVGSITVKVVDPTYTYVNVNSNVKYSASALNISLSALVIKIDDYLKIYSKEKMEKFGGNLDMSVVSEFINRIDASIKGNSTMITYEKRFVPAVNATNSYSFSFGHAIEPESLNITGFTVVDLDSAGWTYKIVDSVSGVLSVIKVNAQAGVIVIEDDIGTVDHDTGYVTINTFRPNTLTDAYVKAIAYPNAYGDQSMVGIKNSIIKFNNINVTTTSVDR